MKRSTPSSADVQAEKSLTENSAPAENDVDTRVPLTEAFAEDAAPADKSSDSFSQKVKRAFCSRAGIWKVLEWFAPKKGDVVPELIRKCCFFVALCVLLGSVSYLVNDTFLIPYSNTLTVNSLKEMYTPGQSIDLTQEEQDYQGYPEGMSEDFKKLYYVNNDVRGWISYPSSSEYWYDINYPVVQASDNDYYLYRDFYRTDNKNGTLFFDYRVDLSSPDAYNKMTIIYGHNMRSGQMFASLNRLVNLGYARSAPIVSLNTLYRNSQYKVFAVFIMDEDEADHWNFLQTEFTDSSMQAYLDEVQLRTLYFYEDVDVNVSDEFLMLYTCGNTVDNHLSNGRTVVLARRVRDGESAAVNVAAIVENPNPLMPKAWYTNQDLALPDYYTTGRPTSTTTSSNTSGSSTTASPVTDPTTSTAPVDPTVSTVPADPTASTTATTPTSDTTNAPNRTTTTAKPTVVVKPNGTTTTVKPDGTTKPNATTTTADPAKPTKPAETTTTTAPTTKPTEPALPSVSSLLPALIATNAGVQQEDAYVWSTTANWNAVFPSNTEVTQTGLFYYDFTVETDNGGFKLMLDGYTNDSWNLTTLIAQAHGVALNGDKLPAGTYRGTLDVSSLPALSNGSAVFGMCRGTVTIRELGFTS